MLNDLRHILARSHKELLQDTLGIVAIGIMMAVILHVPGVI